MKAKKIVEIEQDFEKLCQYMDSIMPKDNVNVPDFDGVWDNISEDVLSRIDMSKERKILMIIRSLAPEIHKDFDSFYDDLIKEVETSKEKKGVFASMKAFVLSMADAVSDGIEKIKQTLQSFQFKPVYAFSGVVALFAFGVFVNSNQFFHQNLTLSPTSSFGSIQTKGKIIKTGTNSYINYSISKQRGFIKVAKNSEVQIKSLRENDVILSVKKGTLYLHLSHLKEGYSFKVKSPEISTSVLGTIFSVKVKKNGTSVKCLRGKVGVDTKNSNYNKYNKHHKKFNFVVSAQKSLNYHKGHTVLSRLTSLDTMHFTQFTNNNKPNSPKKHLLTVSVYPNDVKFIMNNVSHRRSYMGLYTTISNFSIDFYFKNTKIGKTNFILDEDKKLNFDMSLPINKFMRAEAKKSHLRELQKLQKLQKSQKSQTRKKVQKNKHHGKTYIKI